MIFSKIAGITFQHRQASMIALAKRGMLNKVMVQKVPFDYASKGIDTGINYAVKISAQGRKRIHDLGWVPRDILEGGYAEKLAMNAKAQADVLYRGGRSGRMGMRIGLPGQEAFVNPEKVIAPWQKAAIAGGVVGAGLTLSYSFNKEPSAFPNADQLSQYHKPDIEGLPETGMGPFQRKHITDFGSGWDPLRRIAKIAQQNFNKFTYSDEFRTAINKAKVEKVIAGGDTQAGSMGVDLMKTTLRGEEFKFIRKRIPGTQGEFNKLNNPFDFSTIQASALKEMRTERRLRSTLSDQENIIPTIYGAKRKGKNISELYQEYIPGATFKDINREFRDIYSSSESSFSIWQKAAQNLGLGALFKTKTQAGTAVEDFTMYMASLHKKGVTHGDLNLGNVMFTPKSPIGVVPIDFGLSGRFTTKGFLETKMAIEAGLTHEQRLAKNLELDQDMLRNINKRMRDILSRPSAEEVAAKQAARTLPRDVKPASTNDIMVEVNKHRQAVNAKTNDRAMARTVKKNIQENIGVPSTHRSVVAPKLSDWESPWQGPVVSGQMSDNMVAPSDTSGAFRNIFGPTDADIPLGVSSTAVSYMNEMRPPPVGLAHQGLSGEARILNTDFGSKYQGPETSSTIAAHMASGEAPSVVNGFSGPPSPNMPVLGDNLPAPMAARTPEAMATHKTVSYMQDNVPLSAKINIKGTSNSNVNLHEVSQAILNNVPKSKVNVYVNDRSSKLTPQTISDMIDR